MSGRHETEEGVEMPRSCTTSVPSRHGSADPAAVARRTDALLARGDAFGQSRVICNAHWQSDVLEGRTVGAGAVARLHGDATFRADVEAARAELAAVRAKGLKPTRGCAEEAAALAR